MVQRTMGSCGSENNVAIWFVDGRNIWFSVNGTNWSGIPSDSHVTTYIIKVTILAAIHYTWKLSEASYLTHLFIH